MKYALKEWNTTIEALGRGQVIAIWRKGNIDDNLKQFVLFPTFTHQNENKIRNDFLYLFDQDLGPNKDNQVKIKYWAEVEETILIENFEQLLTVSNHLINSDEHLISSWGSHPSHTGKISLLRVYALSDPILITNSPEYAGCKSWIELKIDIPKIGSKSVLAFKDFREKTRLIKALLEQDEFEVVPA